MPQPLYTYTNTNIILQSKKRDNVKKRRNSRTNGIRLPIVFSVVFFILFIGCFVLYLYFTVQMVNMNFDLRAKESKLAALQQENKNLEVQIKEGLSLEAMEEKVQNLELVRADDVRYLQFSASSSLSQASLQEKK